MADQLSAIFIDLAQTTLSSSTSEHTNVELFIQKMDTICSASGEDKDKQPAFFWSYYGPYFREMKEKGHLEAFAYLVCRSHRRDAYIIAWLAKNSDKVRAFGEWSEDYHWLR
jgi:hypothetical protein